MDQKLTDTLYARYPLTFQSRHSGGMQYDFDFGGRAGVKYNGWLLIVDRFARVVEAECERLLTTEASIDELPFVAGMSEKMGKMRINMNPHLVRTPLIVDARAEAIEASGKTCIFCGCTEEVQMRTSSGWIHPSCDQCEDIYQNCEPF